MDHFISLDQAIQMTTLFRENRETILMDELKGQDILPIAETFDREAFDKVLAQTDCKGLRIYCGMDAELKVHTIIVGVNSLNQDILPVSSTTESRDGGDLIIETGQRCPPYCKISPLSP